MSRFSVESMVGEVTQSNSEGRANTHGAFHAGLHSDRQLTVVLQPKKRHGGCKTCEGKGCNGHCRF